jgi:hypothetical protein
MSGKIRATDEERVEIWNTVFSFAYSEAAEFKDISPEFDPTGGKLG